MLGIEGVTDLVRWHRPSQARLCFSPSDMLHLIATLASSKKGEKRVSFKGNLDHSVIIELIPLPVRLKGQETTSLRECRLVSLPVLTVGYSR